MKNRLFRMHPGNGSSNSVSLTALSKIINKAQAACEEAELRVAERIRKEKKKKDIFTSRAKL